MNTVESDKIIKQYLEEQKRQEQIQLLKLTGKISIHLLQNSSRKK